MVTSTYRYKVYRLTGENNTIIRVYVYYFMIRRKVNPCIFQSTITVYSFTSDVCLVPSPPPFVPQLYYIKCKSIKKGLETLIM